MEPRKYVSRSYSLAAGERKTINVVSNWLTVLAANAPFEIGIDDEDPEWISAGIAIATAGYDKIVLYNPSAESIDLTVAFSRQEVRDTRLTVSGVVDIAQTATLDVREVDLRWKSSDGGAITPLGALAYNGTPSVGTLDLVSAAANTSGVIVRTAVLFINYANWAGVLRAGGSMILGLKPTGNASDLFMVLPREVYVPPGKALSVQNIFGSPEFSVTYDIL